MASAVGSWDSDWEGWARQWARRAQTILDFDADHRDSGLPYVIVRYEDLIAGQSSEFTWPELDENAASALCYTSGTTGPPKGALHAHRVLLGHLPGVEFPHNFFPRENDRFWTPADWAWIGGLIDVLFEGAVQVRWPGVVEQVPAHMLADASEDEDAVLL